MSELFDEVDEDVRRDQLKLIWDRYSIFIVAAAVLMVIAVGGWRGLNRGLRQALRFGVLSRQNKLTSKKCGGDN